MNFQDVAFPEPAGLHDREDAFHEATTRLAVAAEAPAPPQHRQSHQPLHEVVRRFHALDPRERPQRRFQIQKVLAELRHARVVAQPAVDERLAEPPFQRRDQFLEPATSNRPGLKGVPRREQVPDDAKPAATHEGTRAAALDNFSEIALQMPQHNCRRSSGTCK